MGMLTFCEQALQDLRYALRTMAAQPLFTSMAALSLALGIGANTAIYSFMDAILLRSLPVAHPESLVVIQWSSKDFPAVSHAFSGSGYKAPKGGYTSYMVPYRATELFAESPVLSHAFAFSYFGRQNLQIRGQADLAETQYVSGAFFGGVGIAPAAGRLIDPADDRAGAPPVAVLSFRFAQRHFGEIGKAVGQSILINGNSFLVSGVAPPEFFGVNPDRMEDVYLPLHSSLIMDAIFPGNPSEKYTNQNFYWLQVMARLRPGVTRDQAQAALAPLFHNFVESTAHTDRERADLPALFLADGAGGLDYLRRQYSKPLYVLMTLVGLILTIACANTANLLLARAAARRREIAIRLSLGAARGRVVRQLLTESALLAAIGGTAGLLLARWGIGALTLLIANGREDFTLHATLNWHVLAISAALSMMTGLLFGLAPALQSVHVDLFPALKQMRAGEPVRRFAGRLRLSLSHGLAVAEIAITLLLLVAAGLFLRTLGNLHAIEIGFNREHLLLFTVNAKQAGYRDQALVRFYDDLQTRLQTIPGVRSVSASNYALVSGSMSSWSNYKIPGYTRKEPSISGLDIAPGFFTTMQIPILLGREIDSRDLASASPTAVVNEIFVKTFFGGQSPLGQRFSMAGLANIEIVGVAKNARYDSLKRDIPPLVYFPYGQRLKGLGQLIFELRAAGDPIGLAGSARRVVRDADARVPLWNIVTQGQQIEQGIGQERTFAMLCACFAVLAVLIACVGLYGMMAHRVARRANEIGIRMALGAERANVVWMVMREVLWMSLAGLAIGMLAVLGTSRLVESFLFQMKPRDPLALALAPAILLAAALAAGYGPAWRASRVDPCVALRDE